MFPERSIPLLGSLESLPAYMSLRLTEVMGGCYSSPETQAQAAILFEQCKVSSRESAIPAEFI